MAYKVRLLKLIDRIIGRFLVFIFSFFPFEKPQPLNLLNLQRALFIRPGGIGDAVLLLPSIRELKSAFPHLKIDVLCEKRNSGIFELSRDVEHIYLYDRDFELLKCLKNRYDIVIDTEQWHRLSAVVVFLSRAPVRIGFATNERERLFTHKISYSHDDYEVYSFFRLIEPLVGYIPEFDHDEPFIEINGSEASFDRYLSEKTIALFPGASVKERRWGGEKYGEVAKALINKGYTVLVVGSKKDKDDALLLKKIAPEAIDLTGKTSLRELAGILKKCRLLITADSGLLHLAVGVGTPTISFFGSGIERKWAPQGQRHIVINKHLPCSPCTKFGYTPRCRHRKCLDMITPEEVISKAFLLMK